MNLINKLKSVYRRIATGFGPDPVRDWFILLAFAIIVVIGIFGWNIVIFSTIVKGGVIGSPPKSSSKIIDPASLDAARSVIEMRKTEEQKHQTGAYHYSDPSQ